MLGEETQDAETPIEIAAKQRSKQRSLQNIEPYKWKTGQSGNPAGRKPGPTLKEWVRQRLLEMDDNDRAEFLKTVPREIVWKMAEGNPKDETTVKIKNISDVLDELENVRPTPKGQSMEVEPPIQNTEQGGGVGNVPAE